MPDNLSSGERRFYAAGTAGTPQGLIAHFLYVFLFAYWGIRPLVIFNILSVVLWTAVLIFLRRRQQNLMFITITVEVVLHTAFVAHYIGWGFGVQYYLFTLLLVAFLLPWSRWISLAITVTTLILFVAFYYYTLFNPPVYIVPFPQLAIGNIINTASAFGLCAAITLYFINVADSAEQALEAEHAKSEALLNNVLPHSIATRLKQENKTIADGFTNASILFADIAGFTQLSQQISPENLVDMLNTIFSRFDELVDIYQLEKIKTVGDAYMVASGIPTYRPDHAEALAQFALAMREVLREYNQTANTNLQIRIGLNSGPVVAGVIGKRRFLYDLWGDSVNTASRMESHGQPGEIHITEATRQMLGDKFSYMARGIVDIKGKGPMETYFLQGYADAH